MLITHALKRALSGLLTGGNYLSGVQLVNYLDIPIPVALMMLPAYRHMGL